MAEVNKQLLGFLNGLAKRQYFAESQYTDEFLRTEVLSSMDEEGKALDYWTFCRVDETHLEGDLHFAEYESLVRRFRSLMNSMVSADMDFAQLDAFLTSQMKKRQVKWSW